MPASNLHAQVPTASGLTALAHCSLCVSFVGLGFIMAFNSAKALPYLASARKDIVKTNISGAQNEVGQALTLIDEMKSRFPVIRLEQVIAAARIRLSYEESKQVLAYLELITPVLANIQERAKNFLKNSDKEAADHELAALEEILNFKTAARPVEVAEKNLLAGRSAVRQISSRKCRSLDRGSRKQPSLHGRESSHPYVAS
jgi:hypothetical protein